MNSKNPLAVKLAYKLQSQSDFAQNPIIHAFSQLNKHRLV